VFMALSIPDHAFVLCGTQAGCDRKHSFSVFS
jgi:hypothetical protein